MKKKIITLAIVVCGLVSIQATTLNETSSIQTEDSICATCTGEFKIDGKSYDITLHDVSWWTCVKFKVGSWFK
ncbi:hypothetical protein OAT18_00600 [Tenacibaculum sp.]|nr:hypothetical protein [Tenacibaculum sp.]